MLNTLLRTVFSAERHLVSRIGFPMGLSILAEAGVGDDDGRPRA